MHSFTRDKGNTPNYLNELLILNSSMHTRNTRYCNLNLLCPRYSYATEGGRSFTVRFIRDWNSLPISLRVLDSYSRFKTSLFKKFFYHPDSGWSRDQPQPGSLFQRLREAEKRNPGTRLEKTLAHTVMIPTLIGLKI